MAWYVAVNVLATEDFSPLFIIPDILFEEETTYVGIHVAWCISFSLVE